MAKDTASIDSLIDSFDISLAAQRKSPATRSSYGTAVRQFAAFLTARGLATDIAATRREDVEAFIIDLLNRWKPTTAHNRYRGLHTFLAWAVRYPHAFRHAWAHRASAAQMSESNIMALAGWRSTEMIRRYAASTRAERAAAEARKLLFGEDP